MSASRLSEWQAQFRGFLYRGHHEDELAKQVRTDAATTPNERLDVYRHAYFIRLEQALAHDFRVTERVLGKAAFAKCAGDYVLQHPSRSPSLRMLGDAFPDWLLRGSTTAAIADLAAIEWAALNVFDGPDVNPVVADRLEAFSPEDWPQLIVHRVPTLTILPLTSNADRVWLDKGYETKLIADSERHIAVWRGDEYRPILTAINADTFAVLNVFTNGVTLSVASERLAEQFSSAAVPQAIARVLHLALAHGWIAAIELDT